VIHGQGNRGNHVLACQRLDMDGRECDLRLRGALRVKKGMSFRLRADSWFLVGWLAIEIVAAIGMTPFPGQRGE